MSQARRRSWRLLRRTLDGQGRALVAGAASGTVWMLSMAAVPAVVSRAVDAGIVDGEPVAVAGWLAALGAVTVVQLVAGGARHWIACRLYYSTTALVSGSVAARALDRRGGVRDASGSLLSLVTSDAGRVGAVADLCCRGSGAVTSLLLVSALLVAISAPLAAAVLGALVLLLAASLLLLRSLDRRATEEQRRRARVAAVVADVIAGLGVLRGLGAVDAARDRVADVNDRARRAAVATGRFEAVWEAVSVLVLGVLLAVTLGVGGHLVSGGSLSIGQLVGFLAYGQFLLTPVATLVEVGDVWARGLASGVRIDELLTRPVAVHGGGGRVGQPDLSIPALLLEDVGSADGALDGFDLAVGWGEVVAVACDDERAGRAIGELASRAVDCPRGRFTVGGDDAASWALDALARLVIVDEGDGLLVDGSLRANVVYGRPAADDAEVTRALEVAAGGEVPARVRGGLDGPVGERGRALSGGQRQRVGLARAIAADPPVLVLLDPTSAVDAHTEQELAGRLVAARRGLRATVLVTTSPALLVVADRVVHVVDGRVAGSGRHDVLAARSASYRALTLTGRPAGVL